MKKCPYCSEEIQENAIKCRHCREWLEPSVIGNKDNLKKSVRAQDHPSYGAFTLLSLIIPIAGFIVGIVHMTKDNMLDKKVGEHAIAMSVLGCFFAGIFYAFLIF